MQNVYDFLETFKKIDLKDEVQFALLDTRDTYSELQREQIVSGKRSDGENIFNLETGSDEYSPQYAKRKGFKKPINLRDTGDFTDSIFMDVRDEELIIDSADEKSGMLQKRYGDQIFGLDDKPGEHFAEQVGIVLVQNVTDKLSK